MFEELKNTSQNLKLSDQAKERIINNCCKITQKDEDKIMIKNKINFKKIGIIATVIAVCAVSASAVITHIRGFRDVVKNGAVVGTIFDEATEMIVVTTKVDENLTVYVSVDDYNNPPYSETEEFNICNYEILDTDGNICEKGVIKPLNEFNDGKAEFEIPLDTVPSGEYTLVINGFELSKKADQPLHISGRWECPFTK